MLAALSLISCTGTTNTSKAGKEEPKRAFRLMFYNVENLFDTEDDPKIDDAEYLPNSEKNWNAVRYQQKLDNIASVVLGIGEGTPPDMIGLCEIENQKVLDDLLKLTLLSKLDYKIIHQDSPDERGIDVAVLYRASVVKPLYYEAITVDLGKGNRPTRDILYFRSVLDGIDTLHFFVNHWPSRSGGEEASAPKRRIAAYTLRTKVNQLLAKNADALIIMTGDFNDDPENESMRLDLNAGLPLDSTKTLVNLTLNLQQNKKPGTLKYKGNWNYFDQFVVSKGFYNQKGIETDESSYHIFSGTADNPFLLEQDTRYQGVEPFRTYHGQKFHGGYSDHLPVYVDLFLQK